MTVLGVVSASGGTGCSTLVAAMGVCAAGDGVRVVVVDGDPARGGLQVTMAAEHVPGHRWAQLVEVDGEVDGGRLLDRLPLIEGCSVLSGGRAVAQLEVVAPEPVPDVAFDAVVDALDRAGDLVVLDWGRVVRPGLGASILLMPASVRGVADAQAWLGRAGRDDLVGVLTRSPRSDRRVAESIAGGLGLPLLGELTHDRRVVRAERRGVPPAVGRGGVLRRVAAEVVRAVVSVDVEQRGRSVRGRVAG